MGVLNGALDILELVALSVLFTAFRKAAWMIHTTLL